MTLKTFENPAMAHLLKSKLESEDIVCFLFDENIVAVNPLYNLTVGGIKLKIDSSDYEKAREILAEIEGTSLTDDDGNILKCPNCGSENIYNSPKTLKGISGFFHKLFSYLAFMFVDTKSVNKCAECGNEF